MAPELLFPNSLPPKKNPETAKPVPQEEKGIDHFKNIKDTIISDARAEIVRVEPELMETNSDKIDELLQSAWTEVGEEWMNQLRGSDENQYDMFLGKAEERGTKAIILANAVIRRFKEQLH